MRSAGDVAEALRESLVSGEFAPGRRLVEADLCRRYDASRGSVREALTRLAVDGYVVLVPNRGARVRAMSLDEMVAAIEVRGAVEELCAARAAERLTPAQDERLRILATRMRDAVGAADLCGYRRLDAELHGTIRDFSGQATASAVADRFAALTAWPRARLLRHPGRAADSLAEHLAIVEAVRAGDPRRAGRAMRIHIEAVLAALTTFPGDA